MSTTCVPDGFPTRIDGSTGFRVVQAPREPEGRRDGVKPQMESLVNELADDLDAAFERLVRVFQDRLFSFAHRLCASRADAEEVAQDAFVRAYRALKTYPAERIRSLALQAWLYRFTLNVSRNRLRGKRERRLVSIDQGGPNGDAARHAWEASDDPESRPDRRFEQAEKRADIASLVATLPDRYRSAIILRYVEGLSLEEVAAILKQPLGTAKSNVHRAVNLLRRAITDSRRAKARAEVRA
jgi:RNA polymerase sigma-70 factor (ECF subfamily)